METSRMTQCINQDMAITIRTIPVLKGETAQRFVEMAEANNGREQTSVPAQVKASISRMMERSRNIVIKHAVR